MAKPKTLSRANKANFEVLQRAFNQGDVALVQLLRVSDGKVVAGLCATQHEPNGDTTLIPLATLVEGNPFELFRPPLPTGGFAGL